MTPEARVQDAEHNLTTSLKYAELLYSQLRHHTALNTYPLRDLAACIAALIEWERLINRGQAEHDLVMWAECIAALTTCVANRLGCEIVMTPTAHLQEDSYYEVEFTHPERGRFTMRLLLPSQMSVASYAHVWEVRIGAKLMNIRALTEEEWRIKLPKQTAAGQKEKVQEMKAVQQSSSPQLQPSTNDRKMRFSPEEATLLDRFEETGALKAFTETQLEVSTKLLLAPTKNIEGYFLKYLRVTVPYDKKIPQPVRAQLEQEFGGEVLCYQANQIVMIVAGGEVRRFIPLFAITSTGARPASINVDGLRVESKTPLTQWSKTGYGYVPPDQHLFLESLRHSIGSFGREMRATPLRSPVIELAPPNQVIEEPIINPPFDLAKVQFTSGALVRFAELVRPKVKSALEKDALAMFARATEDGAISSEGLVKRVIKHNFEEARYFKSGKYRFVVREDRDKDVFKIITVEKVLSGLK